MNYFVKKIKEYNERKLAKQMKKDIIIIYHFSLQSFLLTAVIVTVVQLRKLNSMKSLFSTLFTDVRVSLCVGNLKYLGLSVALSVMKTLGNLIYMKVYFFLKCIQRENFKTTSVFFNEFTKRESAFLLHFSGYLQSFCFSFCFIATTKC